MSTSLRVSIIDLDINLSTCITATRTGNMRIYGMQSVTKASIAYILIQVMPSMCYDFFPFPCLFPHLCSTMPLLFLRSLLSGDRPILTRLPGLLFSSPVSSLVSSCSTGLSHSLATSLTVTMFPSPSIEFYDLLLK